MRLLACRLHRNYELVYSEHLFSLHLGAIEVQRLRKECPHENCGPGVFMATHFNRYHCGKCSLTYVSQKDGKA